MNRYRLLLFGVLGVAVVSLAAFVKRGGGVGAADRALLVAFNVIGGLLVAGVVVDTVWHAFQGRGQACRSCGHHRQMSSFRVYGACPNCGQ